jgi:uncharacterized membrane protein YgcG
MPVDTSRASQPPQGFGAVLLLWMALTILLHASLWATGFRNRDLVGAIEQGAARAEFDTTGESAEDAVRKAIQSQRQTRTFWTAVRAIDDFLLEPFALGLRAAAVAVVLSALAALRGRTIGFDAALAGSAACQGYWVFGLAVQTALMIGLTRPEIETSAVLFLPPGMHSAAVWLALRQIDLFAVVGWLALAWGGWRRGQVGPILAVTSCLSLAVAEAAVRTGLALVVGAVMRLSLMG